MSFIKSCLKKGVFFIIGFIITGMVILLFVGAIVFMLEHFFDYKPRSIAFWRSFVIVPLIMGIITARNSDYAISKISRCFQHVRNKFHGLSKDNRILIFIILLWNVSVVAVTVLFKPYGRYIANDEFLHMLLVMLVPSLLGMLLFWIYKIFVK